MTQPETEQVVDGKTLIDADVLPAAPATRRAAGRSPRVLGAIAVGAFAGGVLRYELGLAFPTASGTFPTTTFAINVIGSFALALLMICVLEVRPPTRYIRPLLGTGFCGAFTTFSTMTVGADQLIAQGHTGTAVGYLLGSLAAGLAAAGLGLTIGRSAAAARRRRSERAGVRA